MQKEQKIISNAPTGLSEYDAIANTVQQYINGGKSGRGDDMQPAFHPQATTEEKAAGFSSYAAYYGMYTINEAAGTITHHVEGSLNPNEVGKDLVRYFILSGNRITLIPVETNDGRTATSPPVRSLTWERVK